MFDIASAFKALDTNNDGKLSFDELVQGYKKYFGDSISNSHIKLILKRVDADGSKFIDYSEWIVATIDKQKLLASE